MAISVGVAKPGRISGVGVDYGLQIGNYSPTPISISVPKSSSSSSILNSNTSSGFDSYIKAQRDLLAAISKSNQEVYAPSLNLSSISAQAREQAASAVNPFYTKQLNDFLKKQAFEKETQQKLTEQQIQDLQDRLTQTLEQNQITQQRTTEDVATNIADVNTQSDQFQTDTGQQFDASRLELARRSSTGGLGAQRLETATQGRNVQESRQETQFQKQKQEQEIYKARTFEDLARAGDIATTATEKGKKAAQFNLDTFIKSQEFEKQAKESELEVARRNALDTAATKAGQTLVQNFINSIANPAQRRAAQQAYGGLTFYG